MNRTNRQTDATERITTSAIAGSYNASSTVGGNIANQNNECDWGGYGNVASSVTRPRRRRIAVYMRCCCEPGIKVVFCCQQASKAANLLVSRWTTVYDLDDEPSSSWCRWKWDLERLEGFQMEPTNGSLSLYERRGQVHRNRGAAGLERRKQKPDSDDVYWRLEAVAVTRLRADYRRDNVPQIRHRKDKDTLRHHPAADGSLSLPGRA